MPVVLERIRVSGVRNLAPAEISLSRGLVIVSGSNAQGKSSLLEAAYLLATTRSYRTRDPREAIAHGAPELRVEGVVERPGGGRSEVALGLPRGRGNRRLTVGEYGAKLVDYLALLPSLVMAGDSVRAVARSPAERRRYIDRATAAARPAHIRDLADYRRALAHRNRLLQAQATDRELEAWDELLSRTGDALVARRSRQLEAWQERLVEWSELFPEGAQLRLSYRRAGERDPSATTRMEELLRIARGADRRRLATTVGPHRDDFDLELEGKSLWRFGSAGQVRSALAALVLAQARVVGAARGTPMILLDDVDTDLDPSRLPAFLAAARAEGQVLAATSKPDLLRPEEALHVSVCEGRFQARPGDEMSR